MKRIIDVLLSLAAIIVLLPLFIIISCAVLISSGWPIFYIHNRVGKDRRQFRLIKFRTMVNNADALKPTLATQNEATFPFFKIKNDVRITKIGRILRKTSLDELPQLFNILIGDMSIVGPRPVLIDESAFLNNSRFTVRPGLTGPTQIYRDKKLSLDEMNKLEMDYVQSKHKLIVDLCIICKTLRVVFKGQ